MSGSSRKTNVSRRAIVKTVPFEPDNYVGPRRRRKGVGESNNLLFLRNTFLAVRNDEDGFYICRALQHVYDKTQRFNVLWLEEEERSPNAYELGYKDQLDTSCILTAVRLIRLKRIGRIGYLLTQNQKQKVENALLESIQGEITSGDDDDENKENSDEEPPKKRRKIDVPPKKGSLKKQKSINNSSKGKLKKTSSALEAAKVIKKRALDNAVAKGKKMGENSKPAKAKTTRTAARKVALVPRGSIKVLEKDPFLESKEKVPFVSTLAHSKLVFRAAVQNDIELLKELINDRDHVAQLDGIHSPSRTETAVHIALENENLDFLQVLCEELYWPDASKIKPRRVALTTSLLKPESTGRYNRISIPGVRYVRKLNLSRGSREGNNAFTKDLEDFSEFEYYPDMLRHAIRKGVSKETLDKFCTMTTELTDAKEECHGLISLAVQMGHRKLAAALMDDVTKSGVNSFNFLHCDVLAFDNEELRSSIREVSIRKKCFRNDKMTPLHCAAINPNQKYLAQLLNILPDFNIMDSARRFLIHYAVACDGTGPLELLLQHDTNLTMVDGNGLSPLIIACVAGRLHNVELLLSHAKKEEGKKLAAEDSKEPEADVIGEGDAKQKGRTKKKRTNYGLCGVNMPASKPNNGWFSYTPLHVAAHLGHNEIIKTLVAYGADTNKELSPTKNKLTPLMVAVTRGHFETVRLLVKLGAKVTQIDKIKRTPMMLASMNGHAHIVSLLLSLGCSADDQDTSGNTALHYAAGYGWYFCVKVLLDAGADCSVSNSWKTTPLGVAFLKGHIGLADILLEQPSVDINFRLDGGLTLVHTACSSALLEGIVEQLEYLVVKKKADCSLVDDNGSNALHHLARNNVKLAYDRRGVYRVCESAMARSVMMAQMLIQHGCDVLKTDACDRSPLMFAVEQANQGLAEFLVKNGAGVSSGVDSSKRNIMHFMSEQCMTQPMAEVLAMLLETTVDKKIFVEMAKQCDSQGMTPLIRACYQYNRATSVVTEGRERLEQWEAGRTYICKLMEICESAADIPLQEKQFSKSDVIPEKEEERYFDKSLAGFNVVHFLVDVKQEASNYHEPCPGLSALLKLLPNMSLAEKYNHFGRTPLLEALARNCTFSAHKLIDYGVDVNAKSMDKETDGLASPLVLAAKSRVFSLIDDLLKRGANPNDYDVNTLCTPLLYTIKIPVPHALKETVETLLAHKASTAAADKQQKTALHLLMELSGDRRDAVVVAGLLLKAGAAINARDHKGRSPLHLAVNFNPGDANCSVQMEQFLMDRGADPLARDWLQRLPLHYVFVKIGSHTNVSTLDPTELYSAMTSTNKLSNMVNHTDRFGLTPLHVAARRGAAVCCLDLIKNGSKVNSKDLDGNSALSLAILHKHESCTILLLQNNGDIGGDVVVVPPPRQEETADTKEKNKEKPRWEWKHSKTVEKTPKTEKFSIFQGAIANEWQGVIFLMLGLLDRFSLSLLNMVHAALVTRKYYLAQSLIRKAKNKKELAAKLEHDQNLVHILAKTSITENANLLIRDVAQLLFEREIPFDAKDEYGCTPLHYACLQGCQPLVEFILGHCENINLENKDKFGRTAMAVTFWKYCQNRSVICSIVGLLHSRGVSLDLRCSYPTQQPYMFGCYRNFDDPEDDFHSPAENPRISPLMLSIVHHDITIVRNLVKTGASVNFPDMDRRRPLMVAVAENDIHMVRLLLDHGYYEPSTQEEERELEEEQLAVMEVVNQSVQQLSGNVFTLGRRLQKLPSLNTNLIGNQSSSETTSKLIIINGMNMSAKCYPKTSAVDVNALDRHRRSALHYLIQQPPSGSHENYRMLLQLVSAGASLGQKDNNGKDVLHYALCNGLPKLATTIQYLKDPLRRTFTTPHYESSPVSDGITWHSDLLPNFRYDSGKFIEKFEKDLASNEGASNVFKAVPDKYLSESSTGQVLIDSDLDLPYDILMTKIDVAAGKWGLYNFYKMQIIHQKGKDLYVLFTRWGRIGDSGLYQQTPFPCKDEVVKEFCKIFLAKSGNQWQGVKSFEPMPRKYRLVPWEKRIYGRKTTDIKIDLTCELPSKLHPYVEEMISEITDVTMLTSSMDRIGIDRSLIPFGRIEKETLAKAAAILLELKTLVKLLDEMKSKVATTDMNKYAEELEKVVKLSNEYYHLIPKKGYEFERIPILDNGTRLEEEWKKIESLMELEIAAKIIIGAQHSIKTMNPMDYVYRCLDCQIQLMDENEIEAQYLLRYVSTTWKGKVEAIYRVARNGEEQRLAACGIDNRRLLFHGSSSCNLISILSKGLLVAPPEAYITGSSLGKGIYTSDEFEKSYGYCHNDRKNSKVKYMLVCEVALGKIKEKFPYQFEEKDAVGYQSVQGVGRSHPDARHDLTLPTGALIPLGDKRYRCSVARKGLSINHNEYVVYNENQICLRYIIQFLCK